MKHFETIFALTDFEVSFLNLKKIKRKIFIEKKIFSKIDSKL